MGFVIKHNKSTSIIPTKSMVCKAHNITSILSSGAWEGKRCFLLGGSPFLKDFDFNLIENELTIGVNKSFIKFPCMINYAMDVRFYDMVSYSSKKDIKKNNLHQEWIAYEGIKVFPRRSPKFVFDDSVYVVNSLSNKALSFDLEKGIWLGNNSGFGALMLAICLGCKEIGLLGYSMMVDTKNKKTHWHNGYENQGFDSFQRKLDRFRVCFEEFASTIVQQGINVVNLVEKSEDSKLTCFSKDSLKNFLRKSV